MGGRLLDPVPLTPAEIAQGNTGNLMAQMYFQQLFELRRKSPGDDLTTQLVQAEEDGSKLSNEETDRQHHSVVRRRPRDHRQSDRQTGLLALYRNPDQLSAAQGQSRAHYQRDRGVPALRLLGAVVRPGWRWRTSTTSPARKSRRGENRALPSGFGQPGSGRVSRPAGSARYYPPQCAPRCRLAAASTSASAPSWARIEAEIAIATLLRRLPDLRLDDAVNPEWRPTFVLRGLKRLPASW